MTLALSAAILSKDEQPSNFTSFAISLIPLHGLVDKILLPEKGRERDWFEGTISTLGDATWFLGPLTQATRKAFGLGGAAITKEVVSLTNIGIEGIVGSIRLYQSAENFWEGKESVAFGNLGEATLRLFGFSWSAIKFLKSRNKVIRNPEGAKTEAPKSVTPPKTLKASLESLSANDVGGYQKMMLKRKDINPDGWYDVVGHSTSEFFEISGKAESAEYLAQLIVQDPKFTGKVRLLSCLTGNPKVRPEVCGFDVSFAQRLANALKRETDGIRLTNPARKFEPIQVEATDGFYGARELPDGSIVHGHSPPS